MAQNYMENYLKRQVTRQALGQNGARAGNFDTGNTDMGVSNNVVTNNPDVKQSRASYLPNSTLMSAKQGLGAQQAQGAIQGALQKAMLMKQNGFDMSGNQLDDSPAGDATPVQVEKLKEQYATAHPKKSAKAQEIDAQTAQQSQQAQDDLKAKYVQQQSDAGNTGIMAKIGRFFNNPKPIDPSAGAVPQQASGGLGQAMMNKTSSGAQGYDDNSDESDNQDSENDYDSMSAEELDKRARAGDKKAFQVGKQKFGGK